MTPEKKENKRIDPELATDPNYVAYQTALENGEFANLAPGTYVVFNEGKLVTKGTDREKVIKELNDLGIGGFMKQVNIPEKIIELGGAFTFFDD